MQWDTNGYFFLVINKLQIVTFYREMSGVDLHREAEMNRFLLFEIVHGIFSYKELVLKGLAFSINKTQMPPVWIQLKTRHKPVACFFLCLCTNHWKKTFTPFRLLCVEDFCLKEGRVLHACSWAPVGCTGPGVWGMAAAEAGMHLLVGQLGLRSWGWAARCDTAGCCSVGGSQLLSSLTKIHCGTCCAGQKTSLLFPPCSYFYEWCEYFRAVSCGVH